MKTVMFLALSLFCGACQAHLPVKQYNTHWSKSIPAAAFYCGEGVSMLKGSAELYAKCMRHFGAAF